MGIFPVLFQHAVMKYLVVAAILLASVCAQKPRYCKKGEGHIEVVLRPPKVIEVEIGATVSVACAAHGHGMADPTVHWVKGLGPGFTEEGKHMGVVATNKAVLYIEKATAEDVDTYKCIISDCCTGQKEEIDVDVVVPGRTCEDVYGIGNVVFGAEWKFTNWSTAVANCEAQGMQIAFPTTPEENAQLVADVTKSFDHHPNAKKFAHENWIWLGANDAGQEGSWVQQLTGEPVEWTNWGPKQPDNWEKFHEDGQDCMGMHRGTGKWDDSYNFYKRPYVCKCP